MLGAGVLLSIELILFGFVEAKRYVDFQKPGSQARNPDTTAADSLILQQLWPNFRLKGVEMPTNRMHTPGISQGYHQGVESGSESDNLIQTRPSIFHAQSLAAGCRLNPAASLDWSLASRERRMATQGVFLTPSISRGASIYHPMTPFLHAQRSVV